MTNDMVSRERRIRRLAERQKLVIRKVRSGNEAGRYRIMTLQNAAKTCTTSAAFPHSFSLEEAEEYLTE